MISPMEERTYLDFYKNTMLCGSNNLQRFVCKTLEAEHRITYDEQVNISDSSKTLFCESKKDFKNIISKTATNKDFIGFYEELEFKKLYKYSVPFFFETNDQEDDIVKILEEHNVLFFDVDNYQPDYVIDRSLKEAMPVAWLNDDDIFFEIYASENVFTAANI